MTRFQVTARFGNVYEIVGEDTVDRVEADRLATIHHNAGRDVRVHRIIGNGSTVAYELTR